MTTQGTVDATTRRRRHRSGMPWPDARQVAASCASPLPASTAALEDALGLVLAEDLRARNDLPAGDNSAMDGWAVSGPPPWRLVGDVHAGQVRDAAVGPGECVWIATGAALPAGAEAVVPVERSARDGALVSRVGPHSGRTHVRRAGEEARRGDVLLPAGTVVTPPVLGLAAAAGNDRLTVVRRVTAEVLVLGNELVSAGPAGPGRTRDALGPTLPGWLRALATADPVLRRLPDDQVQLAAALRSASADLVLTTGSTSVGAHDFLHAALAEIGATLLVDGVHVKPGHPMLLAALPGGRWLVGLPGNPLAAAVAAVTLVQPLLHRLQARRVPDASWVPVGTDEPARSGDGHRLLPVRIDADGRAGTLPACGSAMLRGLALASGLAAVGPSGAAAGDLVEYLALPWGAGP